MSKKPQKPKKALGRGLSALFENQDANIDEVPGKASSATAGVENTTDTSAKVGADLTSNGAEQDQPFRLLAIEQIKANVNQPRSFFDEERLTELAQSIKEFGIIEPIIVNQSTDGKHYEIIAGERRLRAAKRAGLKEVPTVIKTVANDDLLEMMLIENLQREDLTILEEAESYATIIEKKNLTQDQLATRIGKSRSHITNALRILKAPLAVKKLLAENQLSPSQVRTIINLPEEKMITLAEETATTDLSVRELERRVKGISKPAKKGNVKELSPTKSNGKDPNIMEIEELYRNRLKTKVTISPIKNKQGMIEIEYYHYDELLDILNRISEADQS